MFNLNLCYLTRYPLTKVSQFQLPNLADEEVLRLDVTVEDTPAVAVGEPPQQLEEEQSNVGVVQTSRMPLHVLRQVCVLQTHKHNCNSLTVIIM